MKLISRFELANKNITELHSLLRHCLNALAASDTNTAERSNALASIENIQAEIGLRSWQP